MFLGRNFLTHFSIAQLPVPLFIVVGPFFVALHSVSKAFEETAQRQRVRAGCSSVVSVNGEEYD